ncbi:MAG: hypothetical protein WBG19_01295 [Thermoplasmata archaeon]
MSDDRDRSAPGLPTGPQPSHPTSVLERGDEEEGDPARREMIGEDPEDASRDPAPVRAAVQREVRPTIRIPLGGASGKIGWVRQDAIEPTEPPGEVRAHDVDRKRLDPGAVREAAQRTGIQVGGDDPRPRPSRLEREAPVTGPEVEQPGAGCRRTGEREEKERILPLRVRSGVFDAGEGRCASRGRSRHRGGMNS